MGLFRQYQQRDSAPKPPETVVGDDFARAPGDGKKRVPTPTRAQAEAARRERLHPKLTPKELKKAERDADRKRRGQSLKAFEDKPERVLMRNYVDSRWTITEYMWPVSIVMLVLVIVGSGIPQVLMGVTIGLWVLIGVAAINIWWFWRGFKAELRERYPSAKYQGLLWGMASRMIALRRVRNPGPSIARGESY